MAPTPTPSPPPHHSVPSLHLQCLRLDHEGAQRFFSYTSSPYAILDKSCQFVLAALYPPSLSAEAGHPPPGPPVIRSVTLHLRSFGGVAHTCGSDLDEAHKELHLSTDYLAQIGGDAQRISHEIRGVVVHELVHVFQHNGFGTVPGGVIEGIADWVRLKADLGPPHWSEGGDRWDAGYQTTAYFLAWLSMKFGDALLVPKLNLALRANAWDDGKHLEKLCHEMKIDKLWEEYKKELDRRKDGSEEGEPPKPIPTHVASGGYNVRY